jgi:hypothetical protein
MTTSALVSFLVFLNESEDENILETWTPDEKGVERRMTEAQKETWMPYEKEASERVSQVQDFIITTALSAGSLLMAVSPLVHHQPCLSSSGSYML